MKQTLSLVVRATGQSNLPTRWDQISQHFPNIIALKEHPTLMQRFNRVRGPESLRQLIGASLSNLATLLSIYTGQIVGRGVVSRWCKIELGKADEKEARRYRMGRRVRVAFWQLITDLVSVLSGGRKAASIDRRCTMCWRVRIVRCAHA